MACPWSSSTHPASRARATTPSEFEILRDFLRAGEVITGMQTMQPESTNGDDDDKLLPEWGVQADDQIIWVGLGVFAIGFLLLFGWNWLTDDDSSTSDAIDAVLDETTGGSSDEPAAAAIVTTPATAEAASPTTEPSTTSTTDQVTTTTVPSGPDLDALSGTLAGLPGELTAVVVGSTVTLTGFVADSTEEAAAIEAAAGVDLVDSVTSELFLLEPAVGQVLADEGVVVATVDGTGTELTVSGTLQSEADRAPTIAAAEAVPGVTSIVDRLDVGVAGDLNALPTIPFATGSATILPEGRAIVADAAALIGETGGASFEVQGYTDVTGDDAANLALSEARAGAVVEALIAAGVDADTLVARGFGETDEFASGDTPEALAANRVVRFLQTG